MMPIEKDLVVIARRQVFEEYIDKRKKDFDQWMIESDKAWREKRVKLPYPEFSAYPSEDEIYDRIEMLHKRSKEIEDEASPEMVEEKVVEKQIPILLKKRKDII